MAGTIISGVIFCIVAMIMLGIGVSQLKSKEPVGFYTGEKPPKVDQLSDVNSWNKKHGVMWIIYGICIIGSWICSAFIGGDSIYSVIPLCIGTIIPILIMVFLHHKWVKRYFTVKAFAELKKKIRNYMIPLKIWIRMFGMPMLWITGLKN